MHAQPDIRSAGDLVYSRAPAARPSPQKLVETHLGLVRKIAWHVHGHVSSAIEVGDLVQIGTVALLEAARNFEERGVAAFSSYATTRIRGAMIDQLRSEEHTSELQSLMRISYAVFCLKKKNKLTSAR